MFSRKNLVCLLAVICILLMCIGCASETSKTTEVPEATEMQTKVNTDVFHFSADEFIYQLSSKYVVGDYELLGSPNTLDSGDFVCSIISPEDMVGAVSFIGNGDFLTEKQSGDHSITGIIAYVFLDVADIDLASEIILGIVGVCDPTLDSQSATAVCSAITESAQTSEKYEYNGIQYSLIGLDNYLLLTANLSENNTK